MKKTKTTLRDAAALLRSNPRLFYHKLRARIKSWLPTPRCPFRRKVNGITFAFDFDLLPPEQAVFEKAMYCGNYEIELVDLMKKFLHEGGCFLDVGANVGYLSAIAMGLVGKTGQVHAFEPVAECFGRVEALAASNPGYELVANHCAAGDHAGEGRVAVGEHPTVGWSTMVIRTPETERNAEPIQVCRLDGYIRHKGLQAVSLIKIDTDGFEFPVLKGLAGAFANPKFRPPIICEITPDACRTLNYTLGELSDYMAAFGYRARRIEHSGENVDITALEDFENVLFLAADE